MLRLSDMIQSGDSDERKVITKVENGILIVTINRPQARMQSIVPHLKNYAA